MGAALLAFTGSSAAAEPYAGLNYASAAKSAAILGGAPSQLALLIAAQQGHGAAPAATGTYTPASYSAPAYRAPVYVAPVVAPAPAYFQHAVLTQPVGPSRPASSSSRAPDLFGTKAIRVSSTRLDAKWRSVSGAAASAPSSLIRVAYVDRADQLKRINSWVNHAITFADDSKTYGVADHWASASESLRRGRGDCEDFAIAKMQLLRAAGVPQRDLYLVIVKDLIRHADHAVLAVRTDDGFAILDSNTDKVLRADQVSDYRPIMTFNSEGSWIHGYSERPRMTLASAEPASGAN